jgi:hypothetical protein
MIRDFKAFGWAESRNHGIIRVVAVRFWWRDVRETSSRAQVPSNKDEPF